MTITFANQSGEPACIGIERNEEFCKIYIQSPEMQEKGIFYVPVNLDLEELHDFIGQLLRVQSELKKR